MKWVTDGSKPDENKLLLFVVGEDDVRLGRFLNKDQWDRQWMFCDGSFFNIEQVIKWKYVSLNDEAQSSKEPVVCLTKPELIEFSKQLIFCYENSGNPAGELILDPNDLIEKTFNK